MNTITHVSAAASSCGNAHQLIEGQCLACRVTELEKALIDIAEECEYPACVLSPAEIAQMARKALSL